MAATPQERREKLLQRAQQYAALPEDQRALVRERFARWQALKPEENSGLKPLSALSRAEP